MATTRPRFTLSLSNETLEAVENFRFEHRFSTRNQAIEELIRLGLEMIKQEEAQKKTDNT